MECESCSKHNAEIGSCSQNIISIGKQFNSHQTSSSLSLSAGSVFANEMN